MNIARITYFSVVLLAVAEVLAVSDFATEIVSVQGNFNGSRYRDPGAVLGKPAAQCKNDLTWDQTLPFSFRVKVVEAAYNLALDDTKVITTINPGESITVQFDHKVVDYPLNPYGQDLIVFGNAFYQHSTGIPISDAANMNSVTLPSSIMIESDDVIVSVSQDGLNWHSFGDPNTYKSFPTQAYKWDSEQTQWTDNEMDFTKPVDPNLFFSNKTAADVIELYNSSGGGTSFDLKDLPGYDELMVDPDTGYHWIQYVRLEGGEGVYALGGEVDAVADVAACGDPTHPYPAGDITRDCRVDLADLAVLSESWLECTYNCDE